MLALLTDRKSGEITTADIPAPELRPGGILVRTEFSAISAGTERSTIEISSKSLVSKAMARPDLVRQVIDYASQNGIKAAYNKVQSKLETLTTMGYSCAGVVLEVGEGVTEFRPGDRVACAGGGFANHSEINFVPRNLAVRIPDNVPSDAAALSTIGAIAMQGLRQANITFGETIAIIGAGLVGVLAIQIARAAGCRVVAIDLSPERARQAAEFGAHLALDASDPDLYRKVQEFSGCGVDAAILTAATDSAEPAEMAAKFMRDRGRIVVVGAVGMGVSRGNMYMKELSLTLSRSYGPGRYDSLYEEQGVDYPIGYVRWTERRNMEAFLQMLASGQINVGPLLKHRYPVQQGSAAYAALKGGIYTAIIDYGAASAGKSPAATVATHKPAIRGEVRIGCIGAGSFAQSMIFANLQAIKGVRLEAVASASGASAASAQKGFRFQRAETPTELLNDNNVDALFVISRHDSHASYVVSALQQHKPVFVEKPLAINREQLEAIQQAVAEEEASGQSPFLMVGFNRRFAPLMEKVQQIFSGRREPMVFMARINAGFIPQDHWIHADGGRIIGEFCHFIDCARALISIPICSVSAAACPNGSRYRDDNLTVTLTFADGSIATLLYLANGNKVIPKEYFEVFCEGKIARLEDFKTLELACGRKVEKFKSASDKGHRRELELTIAAMCEGKPAPIGFNDLVEVTASSFLVQDAIRSGQPQFLRDGERVATVRESWQAIT